jgi:hypothetical protein
MDLLALFGLLAVTAMLVIDLLPNALVTKHIDLLPRDQVFRFQRCSRPEERSHDTKNQREKFNNQAGSLPCPSPRLRRI